MMQFFEVTTVADEKLFVNPIHVLFVGRDEAKGQTNIALAAPHPAAHKGQYVLATNEAVDTVQRRISACLRT